MENSPKQDFGNLGNLVVFLNGNHKISERLEIGKKIFYVPLNVPPQHKEEVIIVWLTDILSTNKVLTFNDDEVILIWRTLRDLLSSKRLRGLCVNHWILPISSPFVQTLMKALCEKMASEVQQEALFICECLLNMSNFSPQVMNLTKKSFKLLSVVLELTLKNHSFSSFQSLIILLLQKVTIMNKEMDKVKMMASVFAFQALNLLEILSELKNNSVHHSELIKEIENYLNLVFFANDCIKGYSEIFDLALFKTQERSRYMIVENFYLFFSALLTKSDTEKASYILREFYTCFFHTFKRCKELFFYAVIVTMQLLGISYGSGLKVERGKFALPSLIPLKLNKVHKHLFGSCILEALLLAEVDVNFTSPEISFKDFLNSLFKELISQDHPNEFTLQSLIFIIRMAPYLTSEYLDSFGNLLLLKREDRNLNEKVDEIFCIILSVNQKSRTVDEFLEKFSQVLLSLDEDKLPVSIFKDDLKTLYLKKNSFLPYKFLKNLFSDIKRMGTMVLMDIWKSLHKILSTICHLQLQTSSSSKCLLKIAYIIWLSSCCLHATSAVDRAQPNLIDKISSAFDLFLSDCIEPLVLDMDQITIEDKQNLLPALLSLILVWSEIHSTLCLISDKYRKETKFPLRYEVEEVNRKDLKSLIPFFGHSSLEKLSLSDEDDTIRSYIIQILIQKLSVSVLQESETRVREALPKSSTALKVIGYILDMKDPSLFPLSTDILALHLPSLMPFLRKKNIQNVARCLFYGVEENKELWIKFTKSQSFLESEALQIHIVSLLCTNVLNLFSGKKRKLGEEDAPLELSESQALSSLLLKSLISVLNEDINQAKFETNFKSILFDLEALLKFDGENCLKLRSEKEILNILRTLETFPLSFLQPRILMSIVTLTIIIAHNVGNISSNKKFGPFFINILNKIALSPNSIFIFKISRATPYFILSWIINEIRKVMKNSHIEDDHLKAILIMKERLEVPKDTLHGLLNVLSLFTLSYVKCNENNENREQIDSYSRIIIKSSKKFNDDQALYLAISILICSIEKNFHSKVPQSWLDVITHLCSYTLESAKEMTLSHVTKVPFSWVLLTFCQTMKIQMKLQIQMSGIQIKKPLMELPHNVDQNECTTSACNMLLNWKSIIETGLNFATLALETEDKNLRKLGLDFYSNACGIAKFVDNLDVLDLSNRIWQIMLNYEDHYVQEEKFFEILLPEQSFNVFKTLVTGILSDDADLSKLLKCLNALFGSNSSLRNDSGFKSTYLCDELVISLCIKFSEAKSYQPRLPYFELFKFLSCLSETNYPVSDNAKSLILGLISNCTFKNLSSHECFESLRQSAKLLKLFLLKEHSVLSTKPSSFMSAFTNLISNLLNKSAEEEECSQHKLKDVEKCCIEIERLTKDLKVIGSEIFEIAAFSLSTVLEEMEKNKILPVVKLSMERIIYNLIDLCDPRTLEHLLVCLSPAAVELLQHFYKSYNKSFNFNPSKT